MLTDVFREQLRLRRYALRTEETYVGWTRDFIRFHRGRHPREMGGSEVRAYLTYLASERNGRGGNAAPSAQCLGISV